MSNRVRCVCPQCNQGFRIPPGLVGKLLECSNCLNQFTVTQADVVPVPTRPANVARPTPQPVVAQAVPALSVTAASPVQAAIPTATAGTSRFANHPDYDRCDFCHEYIHKDQFWEHRKLHQGTEADGQNSSYMTLPPEERYQGSLAGIPTTYFHAKCGTATTMPEEIVRTYLINPYFYSYSTFCGGCEKHIRHKELVWVETKEPLPA